MQISGNGSAQPAQDGDPGHSERDTQTKLDEHAIEGVVPGMCGGMGQEGRQRRIGETRNEPADIWPYRQRKWKM